MRQVEDAWGGVDVLVNNAGVSEAVPFVLLEDDDWDDIMELNVNAVFRLSRAAARGMVRQKWGRIINIGSHRRSAGDRQPRPLRDEQGRESRA